LARLAAPRVLNDVVKPARSAGFTTSFKKKRAPGARADESDENQMLTEKSDRNKTCSVEQGILFFLVLASARKGDASGGTDVDEPIVRNPYTSSVGDFSQVREE